MTLPRPRIDPLTEAEWTEEDQENLQHVGSDGRIKNVFAIFCAVPHGIGTAYASLFLASEEAGYITGVLERWTAAGRLWWEDDEDERLSDRSVRAGSPKDSPQSGI